MQFYTIPRIVHEVVDLDAARKGPRASYERCGQYVVNKLEAIYK